MTLRDYFRQVYQPRRLLGRSAGTVRLYEILFRRLGEYLGREPELADLQTDIFAPFLAAYASSHAPITTNKFIQQAHALSRYACLKHLLDEPTDVALLPEPRRIKSYWTPEQVGTLVVAARQLRGEICGLPAALYWRAAILVC